MLRNEDMTLNKSEILVSFEKLQGLGTQVLHPHVTNSQLDGTADIPSPIEGDRVPQLASLYHSQLSDTSCVPVYMPTWVLSLYHLQ